MEGDNYDLLVLVIDVVNFCAHHNSVFVACVSENNSICAIKCWILLCCVHRKDVTRET